MSEQHRPNPDLDLGDVVTGLVDEPGWCRVVMGVLNPGWYVVDADGESWLVRDPRPVPVMHLQFRIGRALAIERGLDQTMTDDELSTVFRDAERIIVGDSVPLASDTSSLTSDADTGVVWSKLMSAIDELIEQG